MRETHAIGWHHSYSHIYSLILALLCDSKNGAIVNFSRDGALGPKKKRLEMRASLHEKTSGKRDLKKNVSQRAAKDRVNCVTRFMPTGPTEWKR